VKQIVQNYRTGDLRSTDVPAPACRAGGVLVANRASLISAGTERMKVEVAKKSLLGKAMQRPDQVKKVIESVRQQGLLQTYEKVMNKLDTLTPLGYSCAGTVIEVGRDLTEFQVGEPVACAGAGYAVHAEVISVPRQLVVPVSASTSFERASFTTLGAIALQGIRQGEIRLGEDVVVIGLGLVGLLTVQLLKANGARVIGVELDPRRAELARMLGADRVAVGSSTEVLEMVRQATGGRGADAVLVTAASASSGPVELAGELCRDRGRVVVVGITRMDLPHRLYYEKELTLLLSRSYGPGRYDPSYEEGGVDYPLGYVRWTERRNLEEFLRLVEEEKVLVDPLITHRIPFAESERAYDLLTGKSSEPYLAIVLTYPERDASVQPAPRVELSTNGARRAPRAAGEPVGVGFLGAGNFATTMLLPHLKARKDVRLTGVVTPSGLSARNAAEKFGFGFAASKTEELLSDTATDVVFVVTRHHLHAALAEQALAAGKSVFVEKPLATTREDLERVARAVAAPGAKLLVGFNRRFAPLVRRMGKHFDREGAPLVVTCRVNAGYLGKESWYQNAHEGGGRIVGEVCHFLDLVVALTGSVLTRVSASGLRDRAGQWRADDNLVVSAECANGSVASVIYAASGDPTMPKERIEVLGQGRSAALDNYKTLTLWSGHRSQSVKALSVDKGHGAEIAAWIESLVQNAPPPISWAEIENVSSATLATLESLETAAPVTIAR
jgi:predicted dehydrogenase/threonine dehydrogenase-like Zn-dependent dehydrogenase